MGPLDPSRLGAFLMRQIPPSDGEVVERGNVLPLGTYRTPDGRETTTLAFPQPMREGLDALAYALGYRQDPNAPAGYVTHDALNKGGQGLAESAMVGSLGARAPAGALRAGLSRNGTMSPDDIQRLAKEVARAKGAPETQFLFHSGTADQAAQIHKGLEPQHGPWVKEVAQGSYDNADNLLANSPELAWLSDQPDWVLSKVSRATGKPESALTLDDIRKHGHVSVFRPDEWDEVYRVGNDGLSGPDTMVRTLSGDEVKFWDTPLYETSDSGHWTKPFGVERDEWITRDVMSPEATLTGEELIQFMDVVNPNWRSNLLAANPMAGAVPLAFPAPQEDRNQALARFLASGGA